MGTLKKGLFLVGDILVFYAALATMIIVRYQNPSTLGLGFLVHFPPFTSILLIWGLAFYWNNLYEYRSFGNRAWLFRALFRSIVIGTMGSIMAFYLFPKFFEFTPRANLFLFAGIFLIFSYFWRMLALHFSKSGALNVIIIGDSPLTDDVAKYIEENKNSDYKIVEWIKIPTKEKLDSLAEIIHLKNAELVVMQHSISKDFSAVRSVYKLLPLEISVVSFSDFYESIFEKAPLKELEENWFIENISTRRPAYDMIKRAEDIFGALLVGAIFILPALLIAVLIRLSSKGPVIYTQDRTGKNGKKFTIYKFRKQSIVSSLVKKEGFSVNPSITDPSFAPSLSATTTNPVTLETVLRKDFHPTTKKNPFGNVLLTDIMDTPNRPAAAPSFNPDVYDEIDSAVKKQTQMLNPGIINTNKQLYGDLYDNYVQDNSMMQFYSTANTRVCNDANAYAQYLYGSMYSGKESTPEGAWMRVKDNVRYINY